MVPIHLVNTFLRVAAMTAVAFFADGGAGFRVDPKRALDKVFGGSLLIILIIGATGALNALADTLIQSDALRTAVGDEILVTESVLRQIRTIHPFVAIIGGLALFMLVRYLTAEASKRVRLIGLGVQAIIWAQFILGLLNIALNVPLEIQLVHLFVADLLWISFVVIGLHLLSDRYPTVASSEPAAELA